MASGLGVSPPGSDPVGSAAVSSCEAIEDTSGTIGLGSAGETEIYLDIDGFWRRIFAGARQGDQERQEDGECDQMNGASANRENGKIWSIAFAHGGG